MDNSLEDRDYSEMSPLELMLSAIRKWIEQVQNIDSACKLIQAILPTMEDDHRTVLELRFGITTGRKITLEETGRRMNLGTGAKARKRAENTETRALRILAHRFNLIRKILKKLGDSITHDPV